MYYDLKKFGSEIRNSRNKLGLTQNDVSNLSTIHVDTIRKIENGKVLPTHETLDLLSSVLKEDLNKLILNYRLYDSFSFYEIKNNLESKIDRNEYETLHIELEELQNILNNTSHPYIKNEIQQLILLTESIILDKKYNNPYESLDKLIEAMKITTPNFTLNSYTSFVYNSTELRILMNIGMIIHKLESTKKSLEILEFCIKLADPNSKLYPKICYNLAYTYHRLDFHEKALKYSNIGIKHCINNRNYSGLNLLYFRKGIAEYLLGYDNYISSLKKAISFSEILNQYDVKNLIINNCKRIYNIEIK